MLRVVQELVEQKISRKFMSLDFNFSNYNFSSVRIYSIFLILILGKIKATIFKNIKIIIY